MSTVIPTVGVRAKDALAKKIGTGEILDALPIGVYCCDLEGLLVQYNRHAARTVGPQTGAGRCQDRRSLPAF